MKKRTQRAFSLIELLTVISIITILASLLMVSLASAKAKSRQAACINNLRQIGLGFTGFALDHEGKYPMDLPERLGGSMEYNTNRLIENTPFSRDYRHFLTISNEVPNVKVMTCPADRRRVAARDYQSFTNANLSYWVNTKAQPHATLSTLAGDWNVYNTTASTNDLDHLAFGREVHVRRGSVLFADGRVEITRSLTVEAQLPTETIAVTKPSQPTPTPAVGAPNARRQPTSSNPAPAAPPPAIQSSTTAGTSSSDPAKPTIGNPPATNNTALSATASASQRLPGGSRRITPDQDDLGLKRQETPEPPVQPQTDGSTPPPDDSEPWNTSGFRLFKMLAFASYLISLLWAIIALLLLYLRSRLAQREREQAAANTD